jgi:predicted metal-dependent hydrolase
MMLPTSWLNYLVHFHGSRDYFECHEILEEYWKEHDMKDDVWVGFIQLAVSLYHERRGNQKGAMKMMKSSLCILTNHRKESERLGVMYSRLISMMKHRLEQMKMQKPYEDLSIPLYPEALATGKTEAEKMGFIWGAASPFNDDALIHRHKLRDRSDVVAERERQLLARKHKKSTGD